MDFFKHQHALCETTRVGPRTRIWAFAHVLPGATLGADCNICDGVFIENDVVIGDRVTIKSGVQLWDGVTVEDDVFIGPNATFTNDLHPRSKVHPKRFLRTVVRQGASIGANATILPGLEIGAGAMVGAGAVVTRSAPPHAIVVGNPARITGYVGAEGAEGEAVSHQPTGNILRAIPAEVGGVQIFHFPCVKDMRGDLMVAEFEKGFPFRPKRYFLVFGVPSREVRGEHAHKVCHQLLVCVHGSCSVVVDNGTTRREFILENPTVGIYVPPMIWSTQYKYSADAVLAVFASEPYDPADYIREYQAFLRQVGIPSAP
jgi:acetyltransferase-like isoleucine patch superfamily enzyme